MIGPALQPILLNIVHIMFFDIAIKFIYLFRVTSVTAG